MHWLTGALWDNGLYSDVIGECDPFLPAAGFGPLVLQHARAGGLAKLRPSLEDDLCSGVTCWQVARCVPDACRVDVGDHDTCLLPIYLLYALLGHYGGCVKHGACADVLSCRWSAGLLADETCWRGRTLSKCCFTR